MKIGIWEGCANGGMMDSMSIHPYEPGDGEPFAVVDVPMAKYKLWLAFLKEHSKWEKFWNSACYDKANRFKESE